MTRTPPQNLEAEQSVLGSCLLDPEAFEYMKDEILPEYFYKEAHRVIYRHMLKLSQRLEPIELVGLNESLGRTSELEAIGGTAYLIGLGDSVPTAAYVQHYAQIVKQKAQLRELIAISGQTMQQAYDAAEEPLQIIEKTQDELSKLATRGHTRGFYNTLELSNRFMENLEIRKASPEALAISTGFPSINKFLTGFQKGKLYILAARPAMGKSALALAMAATAAHRYGNVAFFSLEMDADEIYERLVSSESRVSSERIKHPEQLVSHDHQRITDTLGKLSNSGLFINDDATLDISQMKAAARKLNSKNRLSLIVIDYTQLIEGGGATRQEEVSKISRGLKLLARELEVPVLALSQLSRAVESRPNKTPMLSDLRESGSLEQDADVVMFIYRDDYYDSKSPKQGIAEIIIAKNRSGATGTAELTFIDRHVRFEEIAREKDRYQQGASHAN